MNKLIILLIALLSFNLLLSAPGDLIWKFKTEASVKSSPYVSGTTVFVGSNDTYIYALNRTNGDFKWKYKTGGEVISSPEFYGNMVFAGSRDGIMYAIQADNGNMLWTFNAGQPIISSPNMDSGGRLIFGCDNHFIYEIDSQTGNVLFTTQTYAAVVTKAFGAGLYFDCSWYSMGDVSGVLWTIMPGQGTAERVSMGSPIYASIAESYNRYLGTYDGKIHALNFPQRDPLFLWEYQTGGAIYSTPEIAESKLYIGSADTYLYSLNLEDGALKWRFKTNGEVNSSPFYNYNCIFFGSQDFYVYCVRAGNGSLVWKFQTGGEVNSSPAVSLGTVIIGSDDGYVYAIETDISEETDFDKQENYSVTPSKSFLVSPNPFIDRLSISLPSSASIYSLTGQLITKLDKGKHSIDTSKWKQGVYIVKSGKESRRVVKIN